MITIHEDIAKVSKLLMFDEPFYGLFLLTLNKTITQDDAECPTAGVGKNGINQQLIINEKYWNGLKPEHRRGLLKHELLHIIFFHLNMRDILPDRYIANLAMDIEVNQYIDKKYDSGDGIYLTTWPELNLKPFEGTRHYYDELKKALQSSNCPQGLKNQYMGMIAGTISMHGTWDQFEGLTEAEKQLMKKQIDHQIKELVENNKKSCGKIPGELQAYIDELFTVTPPVFDWKAYLRRFVGGSLKVYTKKTRRKESKRFSGSPALRVKPKNHILCAIDTSGSVSDKELIEFMNEIHHMHKAGVSITIAQCDADIHDIKEYNGKFDGRIHGRGGTSFEEPIKYFNEHKRQFSTLIYLTDGYASTPHNKPRGSMLWVISSNGKGQPDLPGHQIKIPGGTTGN